jgi:hypothetical protein
MIGLLKKIFAPGTSVPIPVEPGRRSQRERLAFLEEHFNLDPKVPFEVLETLEKLVISVPDLSQALRRSVQLGNTGHHVELEGLNDRQKAAAMEELERFIPRAFSPGGGTDALVNALLRQIMITGAVSVESVPSVALDAVDQIVLVPTRTIRFKRRDDRYVPYQSAFPEDVELNEYQYSYIPLIQGEDNPYGIPPMIAALDAVYLQLDGMDNVKGIYKKHGLLGFLFAKKRIPPNEGKSPREYEEYLRNHLKHFADSFRQNFSSGAAVGYDDTTVEYHSLTADSKGAIDIFNMVEQQVASGIDIDPALLGRTYSTTETYAGVVYHAFLSGLANSRRLVKRVLEQIYWLHLVLRGYPVKRVRVTFNPDRSLQPHQDAQAEELRVHTVILKLQAGIIDPDTAARELGYAKATGQPAAIGLRADGPGWAMGTYPPPALMNLTGMEAMLITPEEEARVVREVEEHETTALDTLHRTYGSEIMRISEEAESMARAGKTGEDVFKYIDREMRGVFPGRLYEAMKARLALAWLSGTKVRMKDRIVEAQTTATERLHSAITWLRGVQLYDYGKVYGEISGQMRNDVLKALEGEPADRDAIEERAKSVARAVAARMGVDFDEQRLNVNDLVERYRMVVSGAVMKARNFSQALAYRELGIEELEIVAIIDQITSPLCREMHGRRIRVTTAAEYVDDVLSTPANQVVKRFPWQPVSGGSSTEQILSAMPVKLPPYHGRCRTTVSVSTETVVTRLNREGKPVRMEGRVEPEEGARHHKKNNAVAKTWVAGLRQDELLSKIRGYQNADWNASTASMHDHWNKHKNAFRGMAGSAEEYGTMSRDLLQNFQQLFVYGQEDAGVVETRIGFFREEMGRALFAAVDPKTGYIKTFHRLKDKRSLRRYMRIL